MALIESECPLITGSFCDIFVQIYLWKDCWNDN